MTRITIRRMPTSELVMTIMSLGILVRNADHITFAFGTSEKELALRDKLCRELDRRIPVPARPR